MPMKSMFAQFVLALVAILAVAVAFFFLYGRANTWQLLTGDLDLGRIDASAPTRTEKPHDALMCSPGLCENVRTDATLPVYDADPQTLLERVDTAMRATEPHLRRVDDGSDPNRRRYVTFTALMRYPDTASFVAVPVGGGTGLIAFSRSKLGYSDRGVNLKRLKRVTRHLD